MPGYGASGPHSHFISYGTNVDPASGLASLMGYPGGEPHLSGNAYPDPVAALFATGALLTALLHQRRTGEGQYIDLSQAEASTALVGEASLGYALSGKLPPREGNHHPRRAPHAAYPCRGEDKWIAISVGNDAEWANLLAVAGRPTWSEEPRFATLAGRLRHQDGLDAAIGAWTCGEDAFELMRRLQEAGVAAGVVVNAEELVNDPHLRERGFYWEIDHPEAGRHRYAGQPIRLSDTPARVYRRAPCLGEHNHAVLGNLLGLTGAEIDDLERNGVIGYSPLPRR
jgi:crotonobetainyl-CoA:carnitine CoA-transferase CaiB-like acyl-CoA transferase